MQQYDEAVALWDSLHAALEDALSGERPFLSLGPFLSLLGAAARGSPRPRNPFFLYRAPWDAPLFEAIV